MSVKTRKLFSRAILVIALLFVLNLLNFSYVLLQKYDVIEVVFSVSSGFTVGTICDIVQRGV